MNNYSLVVRNRKTNEIVYVPIEDNYNSRLISIDKLTAKFQNEKQLLNRLYKNKYIDYNDGDIFIIYQNNKEIKNIEVVYSTAGGISLTIDNDEKEIDINNEYYEKCTIKFLQLLNYDEFRNKLYNSKGINEYIKNQIKKIYDNDKESNKSFFVRKLKQELQKYREFRNVALFIDAYLNNLDNPNYEEQLNQKIMERNEAINNKYPNGLTKKDILPSPKLGNEYYNKVYEEELKEINENNISDDFNRELNEMIDLDDLDKMSNEKLEELGIRMDGLGRRR